MKKIIKISVCLALLISVVFCADIWKDKKALQENLVRLHVVANSDSRQDQEIKLQVKNAVVDYLQPLVTNAADKEQAMAIVADNLSSIQQIANEVLEACGVQDRAMVNLKREAFGIRKYDTFSLPSGIYDSLNIQIGEGNGRNWWCVVFPSLCLPATSDGFLDVAVSAGFSEGLGSTLENEKNLRFFLLDCLGKIEKLFY